MVNVKEIESLKELQKILKTANECSFNINIDRKNVNIILETHVSKYIEGFKIDFLYKLDFTKYIIIEYFKKDCNIFLYSNATFTSILKLLKEDDYLAIKHMFKNDSHIFTDNNIHQETFFIEIINKSGKTKLTFRIDNAYSVENQTMLKYKS
jgi:hypothetical protein